MAADLGGSEIRLGKGQEFRIASASKGLACSTTAAFQQFPLKTSRLIMAPRNFTTAVVVKLLLNPWLTILKTTDGMESEPIDYSNVAQDNSTAATSRVDISSLDTVANGDFVLMGAHLPFRGAYFDIEGTNSTASVTGSVYYWNGGAWADISATMSGITSSTCFDQDGIVTWTVPTLWRSAKIADIYPNVPKSANYASVPLYWTRWEVDTAIDSSVTINSISAANRSTSYAELVIGQSVSADIEHGIGGMGCIEALTDNGTAYLVVNAICKGDFV